jgi:hypothetical protein
VVVDEKRIRAKVALKLAAGAAIAPQESKEIGVVVPAPAPVAPIAVKL